MGAPTERRRPPTLKTVAKATGVSESTVSRVFSHPHLLLPETVERVRAAAVELGYTPHPTARALSTGRLDALAVVVPDIANSFFPPLIRNAQIHAQESGLSMFLGNTDEDPEKELDLIAKLEQRTDGLIVVSSRLDERVLRMRAEAHPLVLVNRDITGVPRVLLDSAPGMRDAVEHLAGLGHRHIAYLGGPQSSWSDAQRRLAIGEAAAEHSLELTMLGAHRPDHEEGRRAVPQVLETKATGIIAFDDQIGHGVLSGLAERGVGVPGDLSVVGCDDIHASRAYPPLTTVRGQTEEAGSLAVDMIYDTIRLKWAGKPITGTGEEQDADLRQSLTSTLVVRDSTGPAPAK